MALWLPLSAVTLVTWGASGLTQKLATNLISSWRAFLWFTVAFAASAAALAVFVPLDPHLTPALIGLGALGGLLNGAGVLASFAALERGGKASVVIPIVSLFPAITLLGSWLVLGETVTLRQGAGVACAIGSVILMSRETVPSPASVDPVVSPS